MKRNVKNFGLLVVIVVIIAMFLGGCCYCITCPPYPQPQFQPQILVEITYCPTELTSEMIAELPSGLLKQIKDGMLNLMRKIAPYATPRQGFKEEWELTNLTDTQMVIDNIGSTVNLIENFHAQPGCSKLPFGYVKYSNGSEDYITVVLNGAEIEFYKVLGPSGKLVKMYPNNEIDEIYLY